MEATQLLFRACGADEFPTDINCLKTFLFDKCRSDEDVTNLFGLWQDITKIMDIKNVDISELVTAIEKKNLIRFIQKMYDLYNIIAIEQCYYYKWFMLNLDQFNP